LRFRHAADRRSFYPAGRSQAKGEAMTIELGDIGI
jgi:hypothetical protein